MNKNRAKEEGSFHAAGQELQKGPAEYILVFLVLALIILVPAVFSSQLQFFQENMQSAPSGPSEKYIWLTDAPGLHDGLYLFTPDQLESRLPGTGPLVSQETTNGAGSLVYAIQFNASSPREVSLPPPVANIFFQPIPINRADKDILTSLPGVGPVLAERIVQHREERGPFRAKNELLQIAGIGPKKYAALVDHITLE